MLETSPLLLCVCESTQLEGELTFALKMNKHWDSVLLEMSLWTGKMADGVSLPLPGAGQVQSGSGKEGGWTGQSLRVPCRRKRSLLKKKKMLGGFQMCRRDKCYSLLFLFYKEKKERVFIRLFVNKQKPK